MTPQLIHDHVHASMRSLWPGADIEIHGAGTEVIRARIVLPAPVGTLSDWHTLICELPSDDDGFFHFTGDTSGAVILIPYPA